jgi:hypothetical protein
VRDEADVAVGFGDCLQVSRAGDGSLEKPRLARGFVQRREEICDTGGAVREIGHQTREGGVHGPLEPVFLRNAQLEQPITGANRQRPRTVVA